VAAGSLAAGVGELETETMKFRPLHNRVVIRRLNAEQKTSGGIIIPDTAQEKPMEGEVVAAGPGLRNELGTVAPLDVKAGDRILFAKWCDRGCTCAEILCGQADSGKQEQVLTPAGLYQPRVTDATTNLQGRHENGC
jgi:chaperonin GroES